MNKVETKVEALFHILNSAVLTDAQKQTLLDKYAPRISNDGFLSATDQSTRSQQTNKERVTKKLFHLIEKGFEVKPTRKRVPVPPQVKAARAEEKRRRAEVKEMRKKIDL